MNEFLILLLDWMAGVLIGVVFFGGLWWTVRKGMFSNNPALYFLGSMLLRIGIALAGFYLVGRGHWQRLLVCVAGFIVARFVVVWLARPCQENQTSHAS